MCQSFPHLRLCTGIAHSPENLPESATVWIEKQFRIYRPEISEVGTSVAEIKDFKDFVIVMRVFSHVVALWCRKNSDRLCFKNQSAAENSDKVK